MVLAELGSSISAALRNMTNSTVIDNEVVDSLLKEIAAALLKSDVNIKLVGQLRNNCKKKLNVDEMASGVNKRKVIQKTIFQELVSLLDPGKKPFTPKKGSQNVIMFVGLQGSGKTTTCTKLAYHYQKKGWKVGLVCADTFRAGAFDQLKQNCTKAKIPFFGSYTETDPVRVAGDGVEKFKAQKFDVIIVDTSGRHKQETELFNEMKLINQAVTPNNTILVMDSSIGQAAHAQASAFQDAVDVGSVIITKMDGHAKGGGALSAVAATHSPIVFLGTGEHIDELDTFNAGSFVSRLLGFGDMSGMLETIQDAGMESQMELVAKIMDGKGKYNMRDLYEQYTTFLKMGPMSKMMSMLPGMQGNLFPKDMEKESKTVAKRCLVIMDSMTDEEMDNPKLLSTGDKGTSRKRRVARGAGVSVGDVDKVLSEFKRVEKQMSGFSKVRKLAGGRNGQMSAQQMAQIQRSMDPNVVKQMGGMGQFADMMKQMQNMDPAMMKQMMGGANFPGM